MKYRYHGAAISNADLAPKRRPVARQEAAWKPEPKLFTTASAKRFAEAHIPAIVADTVAAIEAEFHVKLPQRSRDAIAVNALAAILARTS